MRTILYPFTPCDLERIASALRIGVATARSQTIAADALDVLADRMREDERDLRERARLRAERSAG